MERTFVMLKPDAVQRGLAGEIINRFERRGLKIVALKMVHVSTEFAHQHYAVHVGKPFFEGLIKYITSGPVVALVLRGRTPSKSRADDGGHESRGGCGCTIRRTSAWRWAATSSTARTARRRS